MVQFQPASEYLPLIDEVHLLSFRTSFYLSLQTLFLKVVKVLDMFLSTYVLLLSVVDWIHVKWQLHVNSKNLLKLDPGLQNPD